MLLLLMLWLFIGFTIVERMDAFVVVVDVVVVVLKV